jgi:hypothetical protein
VPAATPLVSNSSDYACLCVSPRRLGGWQPGQDNEQGADPGPARDPRLAGFARDGAWDTSRPSAALAAVLEGASGPEWRCPGATSDEMLGLLRQVQALESWAAAINLGILRSLSPATISGGGGGALRLTPRRHHPQRLRGQAHVSMKGGAHEGPGLWARKGGRCWRPSSVAGSACRCG